jgi:hypothetical protein
MGMMANKARSRGKRELTKTNMGSMSFSTSQEVTGFENYSPSGKVMTSVEVGSIYNQRIL